MCTTGTKSGITNGHLDPQTLSSLCKGPDMPEKCTRRDQVVGANKKLILQKAESQCGSWIEWWWSHVPPVGPLAQTQPYVFISRLSRRTPYMGHFLHLFFMLVWIWACLFLYCVWFLVVCNSPQTFIENPILDSIFHAPNLSWHSTDIPS